MEQHRFRLIDDAVVVQYRASMELLPIERESCKYSVMAPDSLLTSDKIEQVMHEYDFTYAGDYSVPEKNCHSQDICIRFSRDMTKRGYLHAPYRMSILMPSRRVYRYTVRSAGQLRKALRHWKLN